MSPPRSPSDRWPGCSTGASRRGAARERGEVRTPLLTGLAAVAVATTVLAIHAWSDGSLVWVLAALAALGVATAVLTHAHIARRCHIRGAYQQEISAHVSRLDGRSANEAGYEPASPEMFERIDAAARQLRLLRQIEEGVHGLEALFDLDGRLVWISPSVERLSGYSQEECLRAEDALVLLIHDSDRAHCRKMAERVAAGSPAEDSELRLERKEGGVCWIACHWRPMGLEGGVPQGLRMSAENIQARKETEYKLLETVAELRRSQALREHYLSRSNDERMRLTALLNVIRLGILFMDRDQRVLYYNRAMLDIWGFAPDENLIGVRDAVLQSRIAPLLVDPEAYFKRVHDVVADVAGHASISEIGFKDGRVVTDATVMIEGGVDGGGLGRVWIYEDVTEARRNAQRLVQLAERDPLTDLYNRRRFHEDLERLLADATRRGYEIGLIMFDLDGFKPINDEFGHQAGDEVLVTMAREVGGIIRRNETFFRLGGDEFAVLVADARETGLRELARRIVEGVAGLVFEFEGKRVGLTASLGIALFPRHAEDGERLVAAADQAMYFSKSSGRNRWSIAGNGCTETAHEGSDCGVVGADMSATVGGPQGQGGWPERAAQSERTERSEQSEEPKQPEE